MSRLPSATGKQISAARGRLGFQRIRIRGSHHYLRHADGRTTVVPIHAGETIGPGPRFSGTPRSRRQNWPRTFNVGRSNQGMHPAAQRRAAGDASVVRSQAVIPFPRSSRRNRKG